MLQDLQGAQTPPVGELERAAQAGVAGDVPGLGHGVGQAQAAPGGGDAVGQHLEDQGRLAPAPAGDPLSPDLAALADGADTDGAETGAILAFWQASLRELETLRARGDESGDPRDSEGPAGHLEWVAKKQLLDATARRHPDARGRDVLHAVDLAWSELSPAGRGLAERVPAGVDARGGLGEQMGEAVLNEPPTTTRAWLRGRLVSAFPGQVVAAGWHSMVLETGEKDQRRLPLTDPLSFTRATASPAVEGAADVVEVLTRLTGERLDRLAPTTEAVTAPATPSGEQT